jgi:hypothetical protein|nr:MAG TPA: hypothetical protein [Caudoviricetes sp.]
MIKDTYIKMMENSVFGSKTVNTYNRSKDKGEVKFHTKPTQVNRKNPILIVDRLPIVQIWMYELKNGYFVLFAVYNDVRSEASIVDLDENGHVYYLEGTHTDIYTRQDLVDYVKTWDKMTVFDIVKLQEDILKISLANASAKIVNY